MKGRTLSRREALQLLSAGAAGLAVSSCVPASTLPAAIEDIPTVTRAPAAMTTSAPPTKMPAPTGTLTVAFPVGANNLDPFFWVNYREMDQVHLVFDTLWWQLPDASYGPCLAESFERIDARTWQFKLRKGVKFENDEPLNAEAVKYSWERSIDEDLACTLYTPKLLDIKGADIIDEYTINLRVGNVVTEDQMAYRMTDFAVLPPKYYKGLSKEDASRKPMGSGPFKFGEWVVGDRYVVEAKEDSWRYHIPQPTGLGGLSQFKKLVFQIIPEATGRIAALEKGDVDIASDIPLDQMGLLTGKLRGTLAFTDARMFVGFNQSKPYLKDVRVRQALNYAVDWGKINRAFYFGQMPRLSSWVLPESPNFNPNLKPYPYDLEKAKELLKQAGVPEGHRWTLHTSTSQPENGLVAQALAQDWLKAGVNVSVEFMEVSIMVKNLTSKEIGDMWFIGYGGGADEGAGALTTLQKDFVLSSYFWENSEWEDIFASLGTEEFALDAQKRKEALFRLQEIAVNDPPVVYLNRGSRVWGIGPRVKTFVPRFDQRFVPWEVDMAQT